LNETFDGPDMTSARRESLCFRGGNQKGLCMLYALLVAYQ
jgi:hypothetical protein